MTLIFKYCFLSERCLCTQYEIAIVAYDINVSPVVSKVLKTYCSL